MKLGLHIERDEDQCDGSCPFIEAWYLNGKGHCNLFNGVLNPIMSYGAVDGWKPCEKCNSVFTNLK